MFKLKRVGVAAVLTLVAASAMASNFRASDQVYVPAAGHLTAGSATFISDVFVSNMSTTDSVDVTVIYAPFGANPTPQYFPATGNALFTLRPMERKEIIDFFPNGLGLTSGFGALIFNGCKAGADCTTQDDQGNNTNYRDIAVFTRIYSIPATSTLAQHPPTNGQDMPGIPWYNYVSSRQASVGLNRVFITGIRNTTLYRSNIGLVNASQYSTTTIRVKLWNGANPSQQIGSDFTVTLGPLGFVQPGIGSMFGAAFPTADTSTNAFVTVEQENSIPTGNDVPTTCLSDGCPGFFAYGSILDNQTTDATTVESVYEKALTGDALNVIYGTPGSGKSPTRRAVKRKP